MTIFIFSSGLIYLYNEILDYLRARVMSVYVVLAITPKCFKHTHKCDYWSLKKNATFRTA